MSLPTQSDLRWSVEAEQRLERAPSFVRAMVRRGIEEFAREQGYGEITPQVMDEARALGWGCKRRDAKS